MTQTEPPVRRALPAEIGAMLRARRLALGLGLREAARRAGIRHGYLTMLETGARCPSAAVAGSVADVLELTETERKTLLAAALADIGYSRPGRVRVLGPRRSPGVH